ncbi:hypothetical protein LTR10_014925 [Elasticomyces elasticus]|nr:hypothetical protein LTR10_014925 [Elasticomyces elasticus]KAK4964504.1 hypothetical protein LTR42_012800 [Elasticomyces elasticus]
MTTGRQRRRQAKLARRRRRAVRMEEDRYAAWSEAQRQAGTVGAMRPKPLTRGQAKHQRLLIRQADGKKARIAKKLAAARAKTLGPLLFRLPAELRNDIYEMVLLQRNPVHSLQVNKDLRVPALLQVSRQVRHETLKIWFQGNGFYYTVRNCNASVMVAWERHCRSLGLFEIKAELMMVGDPNWPNLRKWCKAICREGVRGACPEGCMTACGEECLATRHSSSNDFQTEARHTVIISATDIACRFFGQPSAWKKCKAVLDHLQAAVCAYDGKWMKISD